MARDRGRKGNPRKRILLLGGLLALVLAGSLLLNKAKEFHGAVAPSSLPDGLYIREVADNLYVPWEILWGPDDHIWFTQRNGEVHRLDPETGNTKLLLKLDDIYEWTSSGMLGMVLHEPGDGNVYAYIVYNYSDTGSPMDIGERCVRYRYDSDTDQLTDRFVILDDFNCGPSGTFGSRLLIAEDEKLLMTTGCDNYDIRDSRLHGGVTMRMNLDGSIPPDNPIPGSRIYTYGHRNHQGLAQGRDGILYISEHGPTSDDEISILEAGRDYGWPLVWGPCDKEVEAAYCDTMDISEPIRSWTPTIAPCGLIYYDHLLIPEWRNSLLLATLRESDLRVLKLGAKGRTIVSERIYLDNEVGRIRDLCMSPDGRIFISTSHFERETFELNMQPERTSFDKIFEIGAR